MVNNIITPRCTCSRELILKKKTWRKRGLTTFSYKDWENQVFLGLGCHRDGFHLSLPWSFFVSLQWIWYRCPEIHKFLLNSRRNVRNVRNPDLSLGADHLTYANFWNVFWLHFLVRNSGYTKVLDVSVLFVSPIIDIIQLWINWDSVFERYWKSTRGSCMVK